MMEAMILFLAFIGGLAYFYTWVLKLPKGYPRLLATLPIFPFLVLLPWHTSLNSAKVVVAFVCVWICPSKLILLCWDSSIDNQAWVLSSFPRFALAMLLPIRILGPNKNNHAKKEEEEMEKQESRFRLFFLSPTGDLSLPVSFLAVALVHNVYRFGEYVPLPLINLAYSFHLYLVEILLLGSISAIVSFVMNVEVDLCFDNPYLSSSVGDFWGNRWNRVVPTLLRATVSDPILHLLLGTNPNQRATPCKGSNEKVENKENPTGARPSCRPNSKPPIWARTTAIMASFLVSGLFHELLFFCLHKSFSLFGDFLVFFLLHGVATSVETSLRRSLPSTLRLSFLASWLTSFLFIYATSSWLFFPAINKTTLFTDSIHDYFKIERFLLSFILPVKPGQPQS